MAETVTGSGAVRLAGLNLSALAKRLKTSATAVGQSLTGERFRG
jgi:hypothetical protein